MEEIRAFVGHSFNQDDAEVVGCFLKYFTQLSNSHPKFSWEHAEGAEPKIVAEKVMSLIANKNVSLVFVQKKNASFSRRHLRSNFFYPAGFMSGKMSATGKRQTGLFRRSA